MAYDEKLASRMVDIISTKTDFDQKMMFGGVCFMVDEKMCVGVVKHEIMARIDPAKEAKAMAKTGCREMDFTGRKMKGFVMVSSEGIKSKKQLEYYIDLALEYNTIAQKSKKKKKAS
ncbi:MAG: TfoX/Sxy family protein [Saprospiraceae bacterium]